MLDSFVSLLFPSPSPSFLLVVMLFVSCFFYVVRGSESKNKKLPPGSMGWPIVGETLKLFNQNPTTFFSIRQNRYGDIFKTHILGCPCVMVSNPEAIKLVMVKKAHMFKPTFPSSKERMIGPGAFNFHEGSYHARLKKMVQHTFLPISIKGFVHEIEHLVLHTISTWEDKIINTHREMKKVAMLAAFGSDQELEKDGFRELYRCVHDGYNAMPFDFPGFRFHRAMKARRVLGETLKKVIDKRREANELGGGLLGVLLESEDQNDDPLKDSQIVDNIFGVIFGAQDTTASVLTWILKYLHDNTALLTLVEEEQLLILGSRIKEKRGLTWDDTKRMPITNRVILETLRMASVLGFTFREAVEDVEVQGFVIAKGWKVLPLFLGVHHSPTFFSKPHIFDPSRFEVPLKPNTFMPFGIGVHSCPGNELAKLEILVLLHHLTTKLRWEAICKEDGIQCSPFPIPREGFPAKMTIKKLKEGNGQNQS